MGRTTLDRQIPGHGPIPPPPPGQGPPGTGYHSSGTLHRQVEINLIDNV